MTVPIWLVLAGAVVPVIRCGYCIWAIRHFAKQPPEIRRDLIAYKHGWKDS